SHALGECGVVWVGTPELARARRRGFPGSLDGAPVLLPTDDTAIRRDLDDWLRNRNLRPAVAGEFEDFALLTSFGRSGRGVFPLPVVLEADFRRLYGIRSIGPAEGILARFYAISMERRIKHPAVAAIRENARR